MSLKNSISTALRNPKFQKALPKAAAGVGIVAGATCVVFACKASRKIDKPIAEAKEKLAALKKTREENPDVYSEKAYYSDLCKVYLKLGCELAKLYSKAFIAGGLSLAGIFTALGVLNKQNATAMAACAAVEQGFAQYRSRVIAEQGQEKDIEYKLGIKPEEVEIPGMEVPVVDENGEVKTNKKGEPIMKPATETIYTRNFDDRKIGPYARLFDMANSTEATDDVEYNKLFLKRAQDTANLQLERDGYLFLNDVYQILGMKKCAAGQAVGWLLDPEHKYPGSHDGFVSFGIYKLRQENEDFINGYEEVCLLDFNVDGNIVGCIDSVTYEKSL